MSIGSFTQFTELHLSVLQEIGNMGAGGAATALADLLNTATDISVPLVKIVGTAEARTLVTTLSGATFTLLITLSGDLKGHILNVIPFKYAERIVSTYFPDVKINNFNDMNEMATSVINEMVNITSGSYANAMSQLTGMFVDISTPQCFPNNADQIISSFHSRENAMCFVNNTMIINDCGQKGNMIFFPEL